ncbi:MAG: succinate--CoA ligase subunit alpha [Candidatus Eiseniibacteriota bacterium]|jgi:succinyl-CoA synthetase alpha subunit
MSIIVDESTRVVVQGITGRDGSFHAAGMMDYGTKVVAGVTPGKGGTTFRDTVPIFNSVAEAKRETGCNASVIYVPAPFAADAVLECIDADLDVAICITEGVPVRDMLTVIERVKASKTRLIGPNCPGIISPGKAKLGIMPGFIHQPGPVGLVSRSGTLTYEVVKALTDGGLGQTTCLGIGGDPVIGTRFIDALELFQADAETQAIVMIGEIGGTDEEEAARYIQEKVTKPVVSFIAGRTAPPGRRMGHAGAIVSGGTGTAEEKIRVLEAAGVPVARVPSDIATKVSAAMAAKT